MNSDLQVEQPRVPLNGATPRGSLSSARDGTKTISTIPASAEIDRALLLHARALADSPSQVVVVPAPVSPPPGVNGNVAPHRSRPNRRQQIFRCVRLALAGALVSCAVGYTRTALTTARSEQAYLNAEITALRAPIAGQIRLEPFRSGRMLQAGLPLFRIENPRFGNEQALSQMNWVTELAQRLAAEADEASVRFTRQQEVTKLHEKMYAERIIPRLELLEHQTRLALAATIMTNKLTLAKNAAERVTELKNQVELQQAAVVKMPFKGVAWSIPARDGAELAQHDTLAEIINPARTWVDAFFHERHADKLVVGTVVYVHTPRGEFLCRGHVESVRAGVGRIPFEGVAAVTLSDHAQRRIAVRVCLDSGSPFEASQFLGVGRNVVVTLHDHE